MTKIMNNEQTNFSEKTKYAWRGFKKTQWIERIEVRDFIQSNYTIYCGDSSFLAPATADTQNLWKKISELLKQERENGGVLDADISNIASITSHKSGYIDKKLEKIVGLQTDAPLKRSIMPFGGLRTVEQALEAYGHKLDDSVKEIYTKYRKSHNQGVFDAYTPEIKAARSAGILTGLPDAYGRGRIIGDYRRVALYGVDRLIEDKFEQKTSYDLLEMSNEVINAREEISEQINALKDLKSMALTYGYDVSMPATDAKEAIQWTYFAFLGAAKEQNGAATSIGRTSTFLDIWIQRDLEEGSVTESEAQELMDHFVMKLRLVRFLRTPDYEALFSGDPTWVTESIGGIGEDERALVTKNSFRILHTLITLGTGPEPNLTVLWSKNLPQGFKDFCAQISIKTSSIQFENDDMMRDYWGDDYAIACCVSGMRVGKQMQFFGARVNLAKALLYAINGGRDEISGKQVAPKTDAITSDILDYEEVLEKYSETMEWLASTYIKALNIIHYMHDRYAYERLQFALHDKEIIRTMACGIAGLSVVADSLSAIKYAKVKIIRDERGLAVDFETDGDFPHYGNNDARVDSIAAWLVETFMDKIKKHPTYRDSTPTQSVLTITSNVVYGKKTGSTPDGREKGAPFAPGANPMHGRDTKGAVASMMSIANIPYEHSQDGISYTFSIVPKALGKSDKNQIDNMVNLLDGYFSTSSTTQGAHHINVNVLEKEILMDAMKNPQNYPQLTIRVSGYAVNFTRLSQEQQLDVINRTFHSCA